MFLSWLEKDGSESRFLDQYLRIYYKYRNSMPFTGYTRLKQTPEKWLFDISHS